MKTKPTTRRSRYRGPKGSDSIEINRELSQHPEWDVGNYGRDLSNDKKYGNLIIWGSFVGAFIFVMVSVAIFCELTH
jgi:hypothetical protein